MDFGLKILLAGLFFIGLIITIVIIGVMTSIPSCPQKLSSDYYVCELDNDCIFNPVFECMNVNKDFICNADPVLISNREQVSRELTCVCEDGACKTQFIGPE